MKGVSQHAFFHLSIICQSFIFVIMVLLRSTTSAFGWIMFSVMIIYIYIELEPKYKKTIFAKNQPSTYETYAKL